MLREDRHISRVRSAGVAGIISLIPAARSHGTQNPLVPYRNVPRNRFLDAESPAVMRYRLRPRAESLGTLALLGLVSLAVAYVLTAAPAPTIGVRWGQDVGATRQSELERMYLLVDGTVPSPESPRSIAYSLLDPRRQNIQALVNDPNIEDTQYIDRDRYQLTPDAETSERHMWVAHRLPGFRHPAVQWIVIVALAAVAAVGLRAYVMECAVMFARIVRRIPTWVAASVGVVRRTATRVGDLPFTRSMLLRFETDGDWFDALFARYSAPASLPYPFSWVAKLIVAAAIVIAIGVPILSTWKALVLAACFLGLVFGVLKPQPWRIAVAVVIALGAVGIKSTLPRADIAEGHNVFMVAGEGEALQRGLPPTVFQSWKSQFDALYPPDPVHDADPYQWRANPSSNVPTALYAASADSIWRKAKYSRQVDTIGFRSLGHFRGGFANEYELQGLTHPIRRNIWTGALERRTMPFYVMYELTPASVGSRLTWKGQVFWYRLNRDSEEIVHPQPAARTIAPEDAGARVYAVFFPAIDDRLLFAMEPSMMLRVSAWGDAVLSVMAGIAALMLTTRLRWTAYARALVLFLVGYSVLMWNVDTRVDHLGSGYSPHQGGDDGLVHDGWGRMMAMLLSQGLTGEALRGAESVYWYTPGMRYFRMVEKLIFGDTDLLHSLAIALVPLVMFLLLRSFLRPMWAWMVVVVFCLMPMGSLSFLAYINVGKAGYGEPVGGGLFLLGLALMLRTQPRWGGSVRNLAAVWAAGAALATSMFIRPNFALAVVWLGGLCAWSCVRARDVRMAAAFACGLALALWMPFHNWYYGGELYLISKAGATISLPITVSDYVSALSDVVSGRFETPAVAVTSTQLKGWLWPETPRPWQRVAKLFALAATCWVALRALLASRSQQHTALAVVAGAALLAHVPMLFVFSTIDRYAMLGWDLSFVVLVCAYSVEAAGCAKYHRQRLDNGPIPHV